LKSRSELIFTSGMSDKMQIRRDLVANRKPLMLCVDVDLAGLYDRSLGGTTINASVRLIRV